MELLVEKIYLQIFDLILFGDLYLQIFVQPFGQWVILEMCIRTIQNLKMTQRI